MNLINEELNPLHRLILAYAKTENRRKYGLLFAFDQRLSEILQNASEILIAQMKLTWWRDILTMPASDRPDGEPLVAEINALENSGISMTPLLELVDGWELVLNDFPWDERQFDLYGRGRGTSFFAFAIGDSGQLTSDQKAYAKSWAYWDFARHCSDNDMRALAFERCSETITSSGHPNFDRSGRPLSILCKLVANDVKNQNLSADLYRPATAAKIIWHGITGM